MDKKVLLETFYEQVANFLCDYGFKLNKSQSQAKRKAKYGFDTLFFDVNDMVYDYSIITGLRIRNDDIQSIRGEIDPRYKNRKEAPTVIETVFSVLERYDRTDLDYEIKNPGNLVNEKTLQPYLVAFKSFMMEIGFDFFQSFKSIDDFDNWFNEPVLSGSYDFERGSILNSSISGIIAAKLSNNPRYEEICSMWIEGIPSNAGTTLSELTTTKQYLDTLTSN